MAKEEIRDDTKDNKSTVVKNKKTSSSNITSKILKAIIPMTLTLGLSVINYYSVANTDRNKLILEVVSKTDTANVTTAYGPGVKLQVFNRDGNKNKDNVQENVEDSAEENNANAVDESTESTETIIYNEIAGSLSSWTQGITLDLFKKYQYDLEAVNGSIIDTEIADDKVTYTFRSGDTLEVSLQDTNIEDKEYAQSVDETNKVVSEETNKNGATYTRYDNGIVVLEKAKENVSETVEVETDTGAIKLNYSIHIPSLIISYIVILIIEIIASKIIGIQKEKRRGASIENR